MKQQREKNIADDLKRSLTLRNRDEDRGSNSDPIPPDLTVEVLAMLPEKSLVRFLFVSKFWTSIIRGLDFTTSFMARSLTQPRLLMALDSDDKWFIFSSPQLRDSEDESSNVATYHMSFFKGPLHSVFCISGGLILHGSPPFFTIWNPTTKRGIRVPEVNYKEAVAMHNFFGYDPIDHQYKVLRINRYLHRGNRYIFQEYQVFTLGFGPQNLSWRTIQCSIPHCPDTTAICINGILYYGADFDGTGIPCRIVSFDVRSENFSFIKVPEDLRRFNPAEGIPINYKGNFAILFSTAGKIFYRYSYVALLILEDAKNHEWSSKVYPLSSPGWASVRNTASICTFDADNGELVLVPFRFQDTLCVLYYNLERNTVREVEIQGFGYEFRRKHGLNPWRWGMTFSNHVKSMMLL